MRRRIVVTGVGLVTPVGVGVQTAWQRLLAGGSGVQTVDALRELPSKIAAPVPRGPSEGEFDPAGCQLLGRGDEVSVAPFAQFALKAAEEAMRSAAWEPASLTEDQRARTGVAIGSGIGSLADIVDASDALRERGPRRVSPYFIPRMLVNMAAGQVSIRAGLRGPLAAPATACATGASAIADARRMLLADEADVVLAGGAEACIEPLAIAGFGRLRALSTRYNDAPQTASRPFDAGRDGFVLGEGAGVLVLETAEHAARRGARVLAELCGVGLSADAHHITSPPEDGHGALRAMRAALRDADRGGGSSAEGQGGGGGGGGALDALDYVNAHGTSTPLGDAAELRALSQLAAARAAGSAPILVSSTKGATGHLLGAAGAVEAGFTVLALHHQRAPPTLNLQQPEPSPEELGGVAHVTLASSASQEAAGARPVIRSALSNSFGFGGVNTSLLFARARSGEGRASG